jgi:hypothetical protein
MFKIEKVHIGAMLLTGALLGSLCAPSFVTPIR